MYADALCCNESGDQDFRFIAIAATRSRLPLQAFM
jgi:hypothetical protein